jgi:hypothetical protein
MSSTRSAGAGNVLTAMLSPQVPDRRPTGEENRRCVATRPRYPFCLAHYLADSLRPSLPDHRPLRGQQIIDFLRVVDVEPSSDLSALSRSLLLRRPPRNRKRRRCFAAGPRPITSSPRGEGLGSVSQGITFPILYVSTKPLSAPNCRHSALSSSGFCGPRLQLPARLGLRSDSFLVFLFFSYFGKLCRRSGQSHPRLAVLGGNRWEPVEQGG